jgi:hypothetical protein
MFSSAYVLASDNKKPEAFKYPTRLQVLLQIWLQALYQSQYIQKHADNICVDV